MGELKTAGGEGMRRGRFVLLLPCTLALFPVATLTCQSKDHLVRGYHDIDWGAWSVLPNCISAAFQAVDVGHLRKLNKRAT